MNHQSRRNGQTDIPAFGQIAALGISREYCNITDEVRMTFVCVVKTVASNNYSRVQIRIRKFEKHFVVEIA
jgi:hypothetical protein